MSEQTPITTFEEAVARIHQLERAVHLRVGNDGVAVPHPPEPKVRHILINTERRMAQTQAGRMVPVAAGYVYEHVDLPRSHVALGMHRTAPGAILVEHPTLQEGETASADELAAIVVERAKPTPV